MRFNKIFGTFVASYLVLSTASAALNPAYAKRKPKEEKKTEQVEEKPVKEEISIPKPTAKNLEELLSIDSNKNISKIFLNKNKADQSEESLFSSIMREADDKIDATGIYSRGEVKSVYEKISNIIRNKAKHFDATQKAIVYRAIAEELNLPMHLMNYKGKLLLCWEKSIIVKGGKDLADGLRDDSKITDVVWDPSEGSISSDYGEKILTKKGEVVPVFNYAFYQISKEGNALAAPGYHTEDSDSAQIYFEKANTYYRQLGDMADECRKIIEINPKDPDSYNCLAMSLYWKAHFDDKKFLFNEALEACKIGLKYNRNNIALDANIKTIGNKLK